MATSVPTMQREQGESRHMDTSTQRTTEPQPDDTTMVSTVDLHESGLLWLINRVVFHPRGYALGMALDANHQPLGWVLQGDGREPWVFVVDNEQALFDAAQATLAPRRDRPANRPEGHGDGRTPDLAQTATNPGGRG
jgi:hypothetical protein